MSSTPIPSGFCVPYAVRETPDKGQGVFATAAIAKGTIVWRHIAAQLSVYDEHSFTQMLAGLSHDDAVYELTHMFGLADWPDVVIRVHDAGALINHDPCPNLITRTHLLGPPPPAMATLTDPEEIAAALLDDRYALVATRDIAAGEEFSKDYDAEVADPPFFEAAYQSYGIEDDYL